MRFFIPMLLSIAWRPPLLILSGWDLLLVVMVSVMATAVAYLPQPRHKALLLSLPIPFTLAVLAVGRPLDATNVYALILLLGFTHGVRCLHAIIKMPIVASIGLAAGAYLLAGILLRRLLPSDDTTFWTAAAITLTLALVLFVLTPSRTEPGHRSPLPPILKIPIIVAVVLLLVILKRQLGGFMTMFPMVGIIAAYEARHCLWTISRQIPVVILSATPMMIAIRLAQPVFGLGPALAIGWAVLLLLLWPLHRRCHRRGAQTGGKVSP